MECSEQRCQSLEEIVEDAYVRRIKDLRVFMLVALVANIYFQAIEISTDMSTRLIVMQSIYWLATFIASYFYALSFQRDILRMVFYSYITYTFRNILRLYDFEMTVAKGIPMFMQQVYCFFLVQGFFQYFPENIRHNYIV
jgi:hypothetical protein